MVESKAIDKVEAEKREKLKQAGQEEDVQDDSENWNIVTSDIITTSYAVDRLSNDKYYLFRVSAINKGGLGEPARLFGKYHVFRLFLLKYFSKSVG